VLARHWLWHAAQLIIGGDSVVVSIVAAMASHANAQQLPAPSAFWSPASAARPFPGLELDFGGGCDDACKLSVWHFVLAEHGLAELNASPGGRAYRWIWMRAYSPMELGYIQIVIPSSGLARMSTSWKTTSSFLETSLFAGFEAAIAKSDFLSLSSHSSTQCLDECKDDLLEEVVNGQYHYVERAGGILDPGVVAALELLDQRAREVSGAGK
jgi:hypothetical protein